MQWVEKKVRERMSKAAWSVPPGGVMKWTVSGIPTQKSKGALVIRFRHYADAQLADPTAAGQVHHQRGRAAVHDAGGRVRRRKAAHVSASPPTK